MTWREIKTITLQKMFVVQGENPAAEEIAAGYEANMPAAANEGLQLLATAGRYMKKSVVIAQSDREDEDGADVVRPCTSGVARYALKELAPDFYSLIENEIYLEQPEGYGRTTRFNVEGEAVLLLDGGVKGRWRVYYNAYPKQIGADTPEGEEIPLHPEAVVLLPLYIASQLMKEDDPGLAVQYRNEFEVGRETLLVAAAGQKYGKDAFIAATGWW